MQEDPVQSELAKACVNYLERLGVLLQSIGIEQNRSPIALPAAQENSELSDSTTKTSTSQTPPAETPEKSLLDEKKRQSSSSSSLDDKDKPAVTPSSYFFSKKNKIIALPDGKQPKKVDLDVLAKDDGFENIDVPGNWSLLLLCLHRSG